MDIFSYGFMQRAVIVAILISIMSPLMGTVIVLKRLSNLGETLSHSCLAGVAIGLFLGFNPIAGAILAAVFAAYGIEYIRSVFSKYAEISTSVIMSLGIGLAALFSGLAGNKTDFNNFLFGSIMVVKPEELLIILLLSVAVILVMLYYYREFLYLTFDEEAAVLSGVPVKRCNFIFTLLTAVVVAISSQTVGALIISSLMVLPVACAMQVSRSYKSNMIISVIYGLVITVSGVVLSFYMNTKPGGTIVLIGIAALFLTIIISKTVKSAMFNLSKVRNRKPFMINDTNP